MRKVPTSLFLHLCRSQPRSTLSPSHIDTVEEHDILSQGLRLLILRQSGLKEENQSMIVDITVLPVLNIQSLLEAPNTNVELAPLLFNHPQ